MVLSRKPKSAAQETEIQALIEKGGSVPARQNADKTKAQAVQLRIPKDAIAGIDQSIAARRIRIPRHMWLLEAIYEKLEREQKE